MKRSGYAMLSVAGNILNRPGKPFPENFLSFPAIRLAADGTGKIHAAVGVNEHFQAVTVMPAHQRIQFLYFAVGFVYI